MVNKRNSNGGRPLKFVSPKKMQNAIDEYFDECIKNSEPLTVTGLALALNTTRETLMDYQNKDEFSDTVKKAKLRIENAYEKRLISRGAAGDIFALKNFGWTDKVEQEVKNTNLNINTDFNDNDYRHVHQILDNWK